LLGATGNRARRLTIVAAGFLGVAFVSLAMIPAAARVVDPVPLPRARPGTAAVVAPETAEAKKGFPFQIFKKKKAATGPSRFSPEQQEILENISGYFNSFRTMQGNFIQFGPHGEQSEGVFYISRPGKIRFHYKPPVKLDVISDGRNVVVRDNRAKTQDFYPLKKTPLRYLLAADIDLTSDKLVSEVREEPDLFSIVIVEKSTFVDGKLTLIFDRKTSELKQWIVTDAQGLNTAVAIYDIATGKQQDPGLYAIKYDKTP
jgi:outer membrane lipoprotein-sorting protein